MRMEWERHKLCRHLGKDDPPLAMVSFNGSCWSTARAEILQLPPEVLCVCVQEHHLLEHMIDEASAAMASAGWGSYWGAALRLPSGLSSGGVAVLVRLSTGSAGKQAFKEPGEQETMRHRAIAVDVDLPGFGKIEVWSIYLLCGDRLGRHNTEMLKIIGQSAATSQVILAGDFQMSPDIMQNSGFMQQFGAKIVEPEEPTCRSSAGTHSKIDYFIVSVALATAIDEARADEARPFGPHRPV